jgi:hypothetical protein
MDKLGRPSWREEAWAVERQVPDLALKQQIAEMTSSGALPELQKMRWRDALQVRQGLTSNGVLKPQWPRGMVMWILVPWRGLLQR